MLSCLASKPLQQNCRKSKVATGNYADLVNGSSLIDLKKVVLRQSRGAYDHVNSSTDGSQNVILDCRRSSEVDQHIGRRTESVAYGFAHDDVRIPLANDITKVESFTGSCNGANQI